MKVRRMVGWRKALRVLAILALQCSASVMAQVTTGDKLPEALKDVRPASGTCRRDDVVSDAAGPRTVPELAPDLGCAVSVAQAKVLLAQPNAVLMDLRHGGEFQAFHIEGALSVNTTDLRSKPYWRGKTVVLMGDGKAEREIFRECSRLKQSGYQQVWVLRGGMTQWLASHQRVTGWSQTAQQLARLSAQEFWLESQNPDNLVLLAKEQSELQADLSVSQVLPQTTGAAIQAVLERRRKELKNAPLASVVLVTAPAMTDEQIDRLQQAVLPVPLLVYADTRDAFVRQVAQQKAIWKAQALGPRQPGCGL